MKIRTYITSYARKNRISPDCTITLRPVKGRPAHRSIHSLDCDHAFFDRQGYIEEVTQGSNGIVEFIFKEVGRR